MHLSKGIYGFLGSTVGWPSKQHTTRRTYAARLSRNTFYTRITRKLDDGPRYVHDVMMLHHLQQLYPMRYSYLTVKNDAVVYETFMHHIL